MCVIINTFKYIIICFHSFQFKKTKKKNIISVCICEYEVVVALDCNFNVSKGSYFLGFWPTGAGAPAVRGGVTGRPVFIPPY